MTRVVLVCFSIFVALVSYQIPLANAQYGGSNNNPTGLMGLINGIINAASDTMTNALETSSLCIGSMRSLYSDARQSFNNNPFTESTIEFHDTGLGASLRMLKIAYMDSVPPLLDALHSREERIDDLSDEVKRVRTQLERSIREMKTVGHRCLTPMLANDIINEIYRCALLPVNNIVAEMRLAQDEVRKSYEQLNYYAQRRRGCMQMPIMQAVPCAQVLVNEIPMFIEGISRGMSVPVSVHSYTGPIQECIFTMRERMKVMCPFM